jgi:hypothetical protein
MFQKNLNLMVEAAGSSETSVHTTRLHLITSHKMLSSLCSFSSFLVNNLIWLKYTLSGLIMLYTLREIEEVTLTLKITWYLRIKLMFETCNTWLIDMNIVCCIVMV